MGFEVHGPISGRLAPSVLGLKRGFVVMGALHPLKHRLI